MVEFANAMSSAGIDPPSQIIADGKVRRFDVPGDKQKAKSGWYILFTDPLAGAFGCWKRGIRETWHKSSSVSQEEREAFAQKMKAERAKRMEEDEKKKAECREKAQKIWSYSGVVSSHPYLTKKSVGSHGVRVYKGSLIIPVRDGSGVMHGLQFISADGEKKFLTGTAKAGCYFGIGKRCGVMCIAEGFATGASIHECTGYPVAVAFDAGNLLHVGLALRGKYPGEALIFCADNDASGVGEIKAREAADRCSGSVIIPPEKGADFNDYHIKHGASAVKGMFV